MTTQEQTRLVHALIDDMFAKTTIPDRGAVHVDVRDDPQPDTYAKVWRRPDWDVLLAEARPGEQWDIDPEACIVVTTGLIAALTRSRLKAMVGHELAHIEAGDHLAQDWLPESIKRREARADIRGAEISGDAPALACGLIHLFRDVAPESRDHIATHGAVYDRADRIAARMAADLGL